MKCIRLKSILYKTKPALLAILLAVLGYSTVFAQAAEKTPVSSASVSTNTMLSVVAGALFLVIVLLSFTLNNAIDYFKAKKSGAAAIILFAILSVFSHSTVFAQAATEAPPAANTSNGDGFLFYLLIAVILIELGVILYFLKLIRELTGLNELETSGGTQSLWDKINAFKPLDKESSLDMGHNYDGIRELDNITPPWFTVTFLASIVFAAGYLYRYHVAHSAPLSAEEYEISVKDAQTKLDAFMKTSGSAIDENNVKLADAAGIEDGKATYVGKCMPCHGDKGQGTVGPNLTDDYWIHGCGISDVYKTVFHGVIDKGMPEWGKMMTPTQIQNVATYIKSLRGTNPAGAKEKQGTECSDAAAPTATTDAAPKVDSSATAAK